MYPLLRPFALGLCIMFFPTFVLGTSNTVLSPVVKGCNQLRETQTFDMNEYRAQKDRLEYEALMRSPETAYLASDEEFDRQLEELGWSPSDMVTMTGMYMAGMKNREQSKDNITVEIATCVPSHFTLP